MVLCSGKSETYFCMLLIFNKLCCLQKHFFGGKLGEKLVYKR